MSATPTLLIVASACIVLLLGVMHLVLTYRGSAFHPRDATLASRLKEVSPRISNETTLCRARAYWFSASFRGLALAALLYAAALATRWT